MSVEALVDKAFTTLLDKARSREFAFAPEANTAPAIALVINFDGAGFPLAAGMAGIPQLPPGAFRITRVHMAAGIFDVISGDIAPAPITATVTLRQATAGAWAGASLPLWGPSGPPTIVNQAEADIDTTDWPLIELQLGDMIPYCLSSITGTATVLTVTLTLTRSVDDLGTDVLVDANGNPITDTNGLAVVNRGV